MSEQNPWKTLSSRMVYENPWIRIREDKVIRPDGDEGIYGVMDTRVATGVVALTEDLRVWLVGQYRYPTEMYSWEIPEGGTDPGEEPLEAIQRELKEETGLTAKRWSRLGGEVHLSNCISSEYGYLFMAEDLEQGDSNPDGTEILQVKSVPFAEALAMVDDGTIVDAISIMGLLRAERELRKRGAIR